MKKRNKAGAMGTREVVLGLLAQRPMSGYDIRRLLGSLSWLIDSPSFGTLYPGLHGLLADGLVTVEVMPSENRPPRKIYSITDAGRRAVQDWAAQRSEARGSLRDFVMRLVLAGSLPEKALSHYLEQRLTQVAALRPRIEVALSAEAEDADLGQLLTLDYGLAMADAEMAWLDRTLTRLAEHAGAPVSS